MFAFDSSLSLDSFWSLTVLASGSRHLLTSSTLEGSGVPLSFAFCSLLFCA